MRSPRTVARPEQELGSLCAELVAGITKAIRPQPGPKPAGDGGKGSCSYETWTREQAGVPASPHKDQGHECSRDAHTTWAVSATPLLAI